MTQKLISMFFSDTPLSVEEWSKNHSPSRRVITESNIITTLCVYRPSHVGVEESEDQITIPFGTMGYEALYTAPFNQPPFDVYAWYVSSTDSINRGFGRGKFRLERRSDLCKFILHRVQSRLVDEINDACCDVPIAKSPYFQDPVPTIASPSALSTFIANRHNPAPDPPLSWSDESTPPLRPETSPQTPPPMPPPTSPPTTPPPTETESSPESPNPRKRSRYVDWQFGIKTSFRGVLYRSRLEARFAMALNEMDITYIYEPMKFSRPSGGTYMPDFFLPRQQLWVELKPQRPHLEEELKCEEMSTAGFRVVLMYGDDVASPPYSSENNARPKGANKPRSYAHKDGIRGMAWIDGEKMPGDTVFVVGASPRVGGSPLQLLGHTDVPHLDQVVNTRDMRWQTPRILNALSLAGNKKFD